MGKYINQTSNGSTGSSYSQKCEAIINDGAVEIETPTEFCKNLVCVVNNGVFAAAAYAFDENEFRRFSYDDGRSKRWFIWDKVEQFAN